MNNKKSLLRYSALGGLLGPIIYAFVVLLVGHLTPGYNHTVQLMSELGETGAPYAAMMNLTGFSFLGISLITFSFGLRAAIRKSLACTAGSYLVMTGGLSYLGEAIYSCDRGCIPITFAGSLHLIIGQVAILMALLSAFILAIAMRSDPRWNGYWQCSLLVGVVVLFLVPLFFLLPGITGIVQRLLVGSILLWLMILAFRTYRLLS